MATVTKSTHAKCRGCGWADPSAFPSAPLLFSSLVVSGIKHGALCLLGRCSDCKLYLQIDMELNGTDVNITGTGKVFRKLCPGFLDTEMKTSVHRETCVNNHEDIFIIHSSFRHPLLSVYRWMGNKVHSYNWLYFKEIHPEKSGSICCYLKLSVFCTHFEWCWTLGYNCDKYPCVGSGLSNILCMVRGSGQM